MANIILHKSLTTAATEPHATNALKIAELGVNTYDGRIYLGTKMGASGTAGAASAEVTLVGAPISTETDLIDSGESAALDTRLSSQLAIKTYVDGAAGTGDITGVTLSSDSGSAADTSANVDIAIVGGAGIDTSATGTTVTITGETASASNAGIVELATTAETNTGSDAARAVTPDGLNDWTGGAGAITKLGTIASGVWSGTALVGGKIANDAIDSQHYADGSIDTAHIAADQITAALIADDVINSEHYAAGSIDLEHMSSQSVDEDNLYISNTGSNGQFLQKQSGNNGGLTWAVAATSNTTYTAGDGLDLSGTEFALETGTASNIGGVIVAGTANEVNVAYSGGTATVGLPDDVTIAGDLTVSGTTTTVNSTTVSIADPIFEMGASGSDDNLDRGIIMKYNDGSAKKAFMGFDDSTGKFTMIANATDSSSVISGSAGTLVMTTFEGALSGNASTATALATARSFTTTGDVVITSTNFDGSGNFSAAATIQAGSVEEAMMADNSVDSDSYVDGSIDTAHIANDQITAALMADNSIDSDMYVDGSIDTAHIANDQITAALIADNAIDSDMYVDGSIDLAHMSANSVDSDQYVDGSVDNVHLANSAITIAGAATSLGSSVAASVIAAAIDSETMTLTNTTISGDTYTTA
tara:strand:+ start:398 stop:2338 length:1941 start_codon:yes stop_codon:yes gene_type:complete